MLKWLKNRLKERGCSVADVEAALSSNKKFKSITIKSKINSPEEVIHIYKEINHLTQ